MNVLDIEIFNWKNKITVALIIGYIENNYICCKYINDDYENNIIYRFFSEVFDTMVNDKIIIYVHNINFDGMLIIENLSKYMDEFDMKIFAIKNNIYYLKLINKNKIVEIRCSYKLVMTSLDNLGLLLLGYGKKEFPYKILERKPYFFYGIEKISLNDFDNDVLKYKKFLNENGIYYNFYKILFEYCLSDVDILVKCLGIIFKFLCKEFKSLNKIKFYSASSLSVKLFFSEYNITKMKKNLKIKDENFIRNSYYGGRCEVFGNPRENELVYHYDFPGMYGICMREKFPYGKSKFVYKPFRIKKGGFYHVKWYIDKNIPLLPNHSDMNKKLMFFNGYGEGVYWFEELVELERIGGRIIEIYRGIEYEKYDYVLKNFVEKMDNFRCRGGVYKQMGKLIVNSLYGRLGMSADNSKTMICNKKDFDFHNKKYSNVMVLNDLVVYEVNSNKIRPHINNVAIASAITAKARIKLYRGFEKVLEDSENRLLYCDTDSIIISSTLNISGKKYGDIYFNEKDEMTLIKDAVFCSPKTYGVLLQNGKCITKIKGFKRNFIGFKELKKAFYSDGVIVDRENKYVINKGFKIEIKNNVKKMNVNYYDKRIFSSDKKTTFPYRND